MPPLGVGSAGACGGLLRRGGLPPRDLQREGWVDNRRIPLNLPLVPSDRPGPPQTTQTT